MIPRLRRKQIDEKLERIRELSRQLTYDNPARVSSAVEELININDPRAIPYLARSLRYTSRKSAKTGKRFRERFIKIEAMYGLGKLKHPDAIPHLAKLLLHKDGIIADIAANTMAYTFNSVRTREEHRNHPAVRALRLIAPHVERYWPLADSPNNSMIKEAFDIAIKRPKAFQDPSTASETMALLRRRRVAN